MAILLQSTPLPWLLISHQTNMKLFSLEHKNTRSDMSCPCCHLHINLPVCFTYTFFFSHSKISSFLSTHPPLPWLHAFVYVVFSLRIPFPPSTPLNRQSPIIFLKVYSSSSQIKICLNDSAFNYSLNIYYVPDILLATGSIVSNKTHKVCPYEVFSFSERDRY